MPIAFKEAWQESLVVETLDTHAKNLDLIPSTSMAALVFITLKIANKD